MWQEVYPELERYFHSKKSECGFHDKVNVRKRYTWKCTQKRSHTFRCTWPEMVQRLDYRDDNGCPRCTCYGEELVAKWLRDHDYPYEREKAVMKSRRFRWDVVLTDRPVIIEIDGDQHFIRRKRRWPSPTTVRTADVLKMKWAFEHGYHVIRLRQTEIIKSDTWMPFLLDALQRCDQTSPPSLTLITTHPDAYAKHRSDLK